MPIYEYHCRQCDKDFEMLARGSTRPSCPGCGSKKLKRKMSAFTLGQRGPADVPGLCGTCGKVPGSCALDS